MLKSVVFFFLLKTTFLQSRRERIKNFLTKIKVHRKYFVLFFIEIVVSRTFIVTVSVSVKMCVNNV